MTSASATRRRADLGTRVHLPARAGLRLGRSESRRRAWRHRPDVQPADGARDPARLRAGRRRWCSRIRCWTGSTGSTEDVEEPGQLDRDREPRRHVRQADDHLGRADARATSHAVSGRPIGATLQAQRERSRAQRPRSNRSRSAPDRALPRASEADAGRTRISATFRSAEARRSSPERESLREAGTGGAARDRQERLVTRSRQRGPAS